MQLSHHNKADLLNWLFHQLDSAHRKDRLAAQLDKLTGNYLDAVRWRYFARRDRCYRLLMHWPHDATPMQQHDYIVDASWALDYKLHRTGSLEKLPDPGPIAMWDNECLYPFALQNWRTLFDASIAYFKPPRPVFGYEANPFFHRVDLMQPAIWHRLRQEHFYTALRVWSQDRFGSDYPPERK